MLLLFYGFFSPVNIAVLPSIFCFYITLEVFFFPSLVAAALLRGIGGCITLGVKFPPITWSAAEN